MARPFLSLLYVAVLCGICGCGGSELGCVPVSGKVTLAEGLKLDQFAIKNIALEPVDPTKGTRRASGPILADGTFVLMTQLPDDGAVPGSYTVSCNIYKQYPPTAADTQAKWVFEPATVEVTSGMEPLAITVSKQK